MRPLSEAFLKKTQISTILILGMLAIPIISFGQKGKKELEIVVYCVEYIGNSKFRAHFGYDNPSKKALIVEESNSAVIYNHGQSKKLGINTFQPGVVNKAFSHDFDAQDRVQWEVILPDGTVKKTTDASVNSSHFCQGTEFITPYYTPPSGGKLNGSLIGAELTSLYNRSVIEGNNFSPKSDDIFQIDESLNVLIEVVSKNNKVTGLVNELNALIPLIPAISSAIDFSYNRATYWFPIDRLIELNDLANLNYARPVFTGIPNLIQSQGDTSMRSHYARLGFSSDQFNLDGSGIRIGVISNSYNTKLTAGHDIDQEDLPGAANDSGYKQEIIVLKDFQTPKEFPLSDEGRAMLQIIHDVAPGADLVFRTGYLGELDRAQGIKDLADPEKGHCDIIVDDITYITEPFFRDGIISQAIDSIVSNNSNPVTYISAAGNFGSCSYHGVFQSGNPIPGIAEDPHNFRDPNDQDIFQLINLDAGTYTLVLQWDDGTDPLFQAVTDTDLDIFLTNNDGSSKLGFNRINIGGAPVEVVPFTVTEDNVSANILINRASGPDRQVAIKYVVFRGCLDFHIQEYGQGSSTIVGHPNAAGTIAVGAVRYDQTPANEASAVVVEEFSSRGGTPIMTYTSTDGTPQIDYFTRVKPDFIASDGVNTSVNLSTEGDSDYDGDFLPNFFGTSAAAPHAAGAAALIIHARKLFDNGNNTAPDDIRNLMSLTAIGNNGNFDLISGHGFIQPYAAIKTFANPKPEIDALIPPYGVTPGETLDPISFTVKGNFFVEDDGNPDRETKILFRGETLTTEVNVLDEQTIEITGLSFLGNPEIQAVNLSISDGPEIDGGASGPFYFSTVPKEKITIKAKSFVKKYGESLPDFSSIKLADGSAFYNVSISPDIFTTAEKNRILERLSFDVKATAISGVAIYDINLVLAEPITVEEIDISIAEKYNIELVQGHLRIDKLPLTITPLPVTIGYGQALTQDLINFNYDLVSDNISDEVRKTILDDIQLNYTNPLPIGVPLVNGIAMVRGIAMVNTPEGDLIKIEADDNEIDGKPPVIHFDNILYNAAEPLPRGIALVNGLPFVQIEDIVDGDGLFYDDIVDEDGLPKVEVVEVSFMRENGISYITGLDGDLNDENGDAIKIAVENGVALVRGIAMVNGVKVERTVGNITYVNESQVSSEGISRVNGITLVRGIAMVNSAYIRGIAMVNGEFIRGIAMVNGVKVPVKNGIPKACIVNGINPRGIAMVNGIAIVDGEISITDMDVKVSEGTIVESSIPTGTIIVNGVAVVRGIAMVNGIAHVRGIAMVNGAPVVRGIAMVNGANLVRGIALVNDAPEQLGNMNFLASTNALDIMSFVNGSDLVSGMPGMEGVQLANAAVVPDPLALEADYIANARGIAMVNGIALARGIAMVNGAPLVRGIAMVNETTISNFSNGGAIVINHRAEEPSSYVPVTFITGTDAGIHSIIPGTFLSNYLDISYGLGTINILPAELEITPATNQSKTYGDEDPTTLKIGSYKLDEEPLNTEFDGTVGDVDLYGNDRLTGSLLRDPGINVNFYPYNLESLDAGANYNIKLAENSSNFEITKAPLTITAVSTSKTYGESDNDHSLSFNLGINDLKLGDKIADAVTGSLSRKSGEDVTVDGYDILGTGLTAGSNYDIEEFISAKFLINKAALIVTAAINVKDFNTVDPPLTIESYSLNGVDNDPKFNGTVEDVKLFFPDQPIPDHLTGSLSRVGEGSPEGEYVGPYTVMQGSLNINPEARDNYELTVIPGTFYINPYGPGTKAIKPVLNCVRQVDDDTYIANFEYKNDNDAEYFISVGENNRFESLDDLEFFESYPNVPMESQPTLFKVGVWEFQVKFSSDDEIRWTLTSADKDQKSSNATSASSSSTKCTGNLKSAAVATGIEEEEVLDPDQLVAYPNPVDDKLYISMKDIEHYNRIVLYDFAGRSVPLISIDQRSDHLEIDMGHLPPGHYYIRLEMEQTTRVIPIIKE